MEIMGSSKLPWARRLKGQTFRYCKKCKRVEPVSRRALDQRSCTYSNERITKKE